MQRHERSAPPHSTAHWRVEAAKETPAPVAGLQRVPHAVLQFVGRKPARAPVVVRNVQFGVVDQHGAGVLMYGQRVGIRTILKATRVDR